MSRGLWFVAGAGAGVYAVRRARRVAEAVTFDGLRDRANSALVGLRAFRDEVATGQAEKETELRERLGLVPHGLPELTGSGGFQTVARATSSTSDETSSTSDEDTEGST